MTARHISGVLNVDKPHGWTSHDVVGLVRRLLGQRQVGHAGTLDPMATGVLVVMVGAATRLSDYLMHGRKCYRAGIRLGVRTSTDDAEGAVVETRAVEGVTHAAVVDTLRGFRGAIEQQPPAYAAIKKDGVPAYKLARRGLTPVLAPRQVTIDGLALIGIDGDVLDLLVWCSAGTYIRALARDLGDALGCGAHLSALRRLSSGSFDVTTALDLTTLRDLAARGRLQDHLTPLDTALAAWPAIIRDEAQAASVTHGNAFRLSPDHPVGYPAASVVGAYEEGVAGGRRLSDSGPAGGPAIEGDSDAARVYAADGQLLALARYDAARHEWRPAKVLVPASPGAGAPDAVEAGQ